MFRLGDRAQVYLLQQGILWAWWPTQVQPQPVIRSGDAPGFYSV